LHASSFAGKLGKNVCKNKKKDTHLQVTVNSTQVYN